MANLRDAVAAILADVTRAQNQANLLSRSLSETYRDDHLLRVFPVPNAQLAGLTLDLRFAVVPVRAAAAGEAADDDAASPGPASRAQAHPPSSAFHALAHRLAETALGETAGAVPESAPAAPGAGVRGQLRSPRTVSALAGHLAGALQKWYERLGPDAAGRPVEELSAEALKEVGEVLRDALVADPGLQEAVGGPRPLVSAVRSRCGAPLRETLEDFLRHARSVEVGLAEVPDFEVVLDTDALARLPEHALQTLRLRIALDEYRWMVAENGRSQELVRANHGRDARPEPE